MERSCFLAGNSRPEQYTVDFPNRRVLEFNYDVIQLNRLTRRLGELNAAIQKWLRKLSERQIDELAVAMLDFQTKTELNRWLKENAATIHLTNSSETSQ